MTKEKVNKAASDAREFLRRVKMLPESDCSYYGEPKITGAIRRQSMELTRSLAELRKP